VADDLKSRTAAGGTLASRTASDWEDVPSNEWEDVQSPQSDPNKGFSQATAISPDTRGWTGRLADRARQWWNDPKGSKSPKEFAGGLANEALLLAPAAVPEKVTSTAGKVALNLAGRTAAGLAGAGAGGWAGREAGLEGGPLTAARVAGGAVGFMAPGVIGRMGRGGRLASRMLSRAAPEAAGPEAVVGTSTARPIGTAELPPAPTTPQAPMTLGDRVAAKTATPSPVPSGVPRVPVPREPMPGDPNLMGSVPRPELPGMAGRGVPGAADQQRLLGEPIVYTPPEGYPPPRSVTNLGERVPQPKQPNLAQRTVDRRVGPDSYKGPERRAGVQDWQEAVSSTPPGQPTPGETLSQRIRTTTAGQPGGISEGQALQQIMRDQDMYDIYRSADQRTRDAMLVKAKNEMAAQGVQ